MKIQHASTICMVVIIHMLERIPELKIKLKAAIKNNVQLLSTMPLTEGYNIAQSKKNDITKTLRICLKSTTQ